MNAESRTWLNGPVPFSCHGDASMRKKKNLRHRIKVFRKFVPFDFSHCHSLDIGASNTFGQLLGMKDNTLDTDLNDHFEAPSSDYEFICCSDIIEHLFNPGRVMKDIHSLLAPGGYCLVSTPRAKWMIPYECWYHFTEYKPKCMRQLFTYYGFEVLKFRTFCIWDWEFMFYGVRPLLRVLFHRNQLWLIRKP